MGETLLWLWITIVLCGCCCCCMLTLLGIKGAVSAQCAIACTSVSQCCCQNNKRTSETDEKNLQAEMMEADGVKPTSVQMIPGSPNSPSRMSMSSEFDLKNACGDGVAENTNEPNPKKENEDDTNGFIGSGDIDNYDVVLGTNGMTIVDHVPKGKHEPDMDRMVSKEAENMYFEDGKDGVTNNRMV